MNLRALIRRNTPDWWPMWRPGPLRCGYPHLIGCREVTGGGHCPRHIGVIEGLGRALSDSIGAMVPGCVGCGHRRTDHSTTLAGEPCLACGCPSYIPEVARS